MGQHKIKGASKGSDYKKYQGKNKRFYVRDMRLLSNNVTFKMLSGGSYYLDSRGALRRANER